MVPAALPRGTFGTPACQPSRPTLATTTRSDWYDNEWGYTNRLVDLTLLFAQQS